MKRNNNQTNILIQVLLSMSCDRRKVGSFMEVSNKAKFEMIK